MKLFIALLALGINVCACSVKPLEQESPKRTIRIGGSGYVISQLTASTWSVNSENFQPLLASPAVNKTDLIAAIEQASGCRVTDSNYSDKNRQLDAQVDCDPKAIH